MGIESKDYLSGKQYKIEGIYGIKLLPSGEILRRESIFTQYLGSEAGVVLWLKEQTPFKTLEIWNLETRQNEFRHFMDLIGTKYGQNGLPKRGKSGVRRLW
jgi:hypothetical protein